MKDDLGGQIMREFVGLRAKTYSYLKDNKYEDKKTTKGTKKCVIKRKLNFQDYKSCLEAAQIENKINHLEKNKTEADSLKKSVKNNKVILKIQHTEEIDKIAFKFKL